MLKKKKHELNADGFLQIVRKYSSVEELVPDILHEFIDKIVVHHREKVQRIEIYYNMISSDSKIDHATKRRLQKIFLTHKKRANGLLTNLLFKRRTIKIFHAPYGTLQWRRKRDLNPRAGYPTYSLSRGAPSASWVFLLNFTYMAERKGFEPLVPCGITSFQD